MLCKLSLGRCGITFPVDTLDRITENTVRHIFISDNRASDPAAGTLKAVPAAPHTPHTHRWKSSLKALSAPCKRLSRQKNSTNSRAQVRWLNILSASFRDYNISTLSPLCSTGCKKSAKYASHNHHLMVKRTWIKYILKRQEADYLHPRFLLPKSIPGALSIYFLPYVLQSSFLELIF